MKNEKKIKIAKNKSLPAAKVKQIRKKPGGSNIGKYKDLPAGKFAGTNPGTFPYDTLKEAQSAIKLAHNDAYPGRVKKRVYKAWPQLKKAHRAQKKK